MDAALMLVHLLLLCRDNDLPGKKTEKALDALKNLSSPRAL